MKPALLVSLLLALALPAGAHAQAVDLPGVQSDSLDVAMTPDGTAHVAYFVPGTGARERLRVCRIPGGSTTCTLVGDQELPRDQSTGPFILASGSTVYALAGSADGATESTVAATSSNGFSTLTVVAPITASDVELRADGGGFLFGSRRGPGPSGGPGDVAAFSPGSGSGFAFDTVSGGNNFGGTLLGVRPDSRPLVFTQTPSEQSVYSFDGTDPNSAAQLGDRAQWGARTPFALPDLNGGREVVQGAGRMWLGYEALSSTADVLLRPWTGAGFGAAVDPDCNGAGVFGAGAQGAPAVAITPSGGLQVAYVGGTGSGTRLVYLRGNPDGSNWSTYQEVDAGPGLQQDLEIAADPRPTADGAGVLVFHTPAGQVRLVRLPDVPPTGCVPKSTGPGATPSPTPTPTVTATPTPTPTPPKPPAKPPALSSVVSGLPSTKRCRSRRALRIRLRNPKGTKIESATVKVNGKQVATRKGKRVTAAVNLRGLPKGRYTVSITVKLTNGQTVKGTRKYRTCAKKRKR